MMLMCISKIYGIIPAEEMTTVMVIGMCTWKFDKMAREDREGQTKGSQ